MAFWCYILRCADGKYYTGHTDDLDRRIAEHHVGGYCSFTTKRRPIELIWADSFPSRYEALDAELKVKKWSRAKKEALAAADWERLSYFAKPPGEREGAPPCERVSTSLDTNGGGG
ncbi:GIY-YIG nuclease family protein [Novosphingobium sp. B 225]|uniref:GIY-YIG nuclease family protein n=1 Tax=Novosphingobium sp. B 225 TaxID=1961849 RepID=UPI000B4AF484|nr:GIY-YIG nuclease family protein [Novosphingobium sp. B 225]